MSNLEEKIKAYCIKYNIPIEHVIEILEDQKVVPMIRGKASEYLGTFFLQDYFKDNLNWVVTKFNLNPQTNKVDQDLTIIHRNTGISIRVEVKNAVRESFKYSKYCDCKLPHLNIKCHKSRSNKQKAETTNDRYLLGEFDLVMSNTSNSIILSGTKTLGEFKIIDDEVCLKALYDYYKVDNQHDLLNACYNDWRFVLPEDISLVDGSLERTPLVLLDASKDGTWFTAHRLESQLLKIVRRKQNEQRRR